MAATTISVTRERKDGKITPQPLAASTKILAGILVCYDANKYIVPGSDTAALVIAGVSLAEVDNSAGADGDELVNIWQEGDFLFTLEEGNAAQADIGTTVYIKDNQTVAKTTTNSIPAGKISRVLSATQVYVRIRTNI